MRMAFVGTALLAVTGCDNPSYVGGNQHTTAETFRTEDGCLWKISGGINGYHWIQRIDKIEKTGCPEKLAP